MYRPQQKPSWREREAERKRIAEEEERRKKAEVTESNFPTFAGGAQPAKAVSGSKYASLAQNWATDEARERQMEEYRKSREESERRQYESFYHVRASYRSDYDRGSRYEECDEYEESASAPAPAAAAGSGGLALPDDGGGWTEVKNKVRKPKRDLSIAEMEARDRRLQAEEDDIEFNAHLYESGRHDHDRV
jgi:hypothetical protein